MRHVAQVAFHVAKADIRIPDDLDRALKRGSSSIEAGRRIMTSPTLASVKGARHFELQFLSRVLRPRRRVDGHLARLDALPAPDQHGSAAATSPSAAARTTARDPMFLNNMHGSLRGCYARPRAV